MDACLARRPEASTATYSDPVPLNVRDRPPLNRGACHHYYAQLQHELSLTAAEVHYWSFDAARKPGQVSPDANSETLLDAEAISGS